MEGKTGKIVVTGDVTVDWFQWPVKALVESDDESSKGIQNWKLYQGTRMAAVPGGALLLARWVRDATGAAVLSPQVSQAQTNSLVQAPSETVLRSLAALKGFPRTASDKKSRVFRVEQEFGYDAGFAGRIIQLPVKGDVQGADIVVLDDAADGFRDNEGVWPKALSQGRKPIVILKKSRPLWRGDLWQLLLERHFERLVVVLSADDLREEGVDISRRLSWERTARDFVWQMASNRDLRLLAECRNLVVRLGLDGAIHYQKSNGAILARLYYDPALAEGGFSAQVDGKMIGLSAAFVAAVTAKMAREGVDGIGEGIREGMLCSRRLLLHGFSGDDKKIDYPGREIFQPAAEDARITDILIPNPTTMDSADEGYWTILEELIQKKLEEVAFNAVVSGTDPLLDRVPAGQFGKLRTLDRKEIEGYRCVENLMVEYISKQHQKRPLSIAVFGPPGAGKSFGVEQIARSIAPGIIDSEGLEFNISQFTSLAELTSALHQVRDRALKGKVPLVFFDEFDSSFQREPLGWLKYFLEPMQSGRFRDGEHTHPIGKAIFVFAGATSSYLKEFSREGREVEEIKAFRKAKGTDFVSRLRGYVDIMGPNPVDDNDRLCMIRRAVLLRSLMKMKAANLFNSAERLQIDEGVLRALIKVPEYKHGVRSMESILDMSMLADRSFFEQSAIPPAAQLELHVPADIFCRLMKRDVIFGAARENLARAIHESYRAMEPHPADHPSMQSWESLGEDLRESNRQQADRIPEYLEVIGYGYMPLREGAKVPEAIKLTARQTEKLARMEHERYVAEKQLAGWTYGPVRDDINRTNPCLVDWEELPMDEQDKDRNTVSLIPKYLQLAGFEVYRLGG